MDWVTCEGCGFTQIPTEKCLRCLRPLERPRPPDAGPGEGAAAAPPLEPPPVLPDPPPAAAPGFQRAPSSARAAAFAAPPPGGRRAPVAAVVGAVALLLVAALLALRSRSRAPAPAPTPPPPAAKLDLSGRWESQIAKTLPGPPPRPALKQAYLETDREGAILAAGVLLTDPGRGGAGAGYRVVSDAPERLRQIFSRLAESPGGAALPIDFIPFPAWMPPRDRAWRALEGESPRSADLRYLILESVEDDYLVQAGINQSGFLSYAFFSREYAHSRGLDALSAVIHPDPGSSLRGFRNLVWDLSGSADFFALEVHATVSGPEGSTDRLTLKRKTAP
jgi:hypothetical protein